MQNDELCCYVEQSDVLLGEDSMSVLSMPRRRITISVDTEILDALTDKAMDLNTSVSRMTETALIAHAKKLGILPAGYRPLGETRGGDRTTTDEGAA